MVLYWLQLRREQCDRTLLGGLKRKEPALRESADHGKRVLSNHQSGRGCQLTMYSRQYSVRSLLSQSPLPQVNVTRDARESISTMLKPSRTASIVSAYLSNF